MEDFIDMLAIDEDAEDAATKSTDAGAKEASPA